MTKVDKEEREIEGENKKVIEESEDEKIKDEIIEKVEKIELHNLNLNAEENIILLIGSENLYKVANYDVIIPPLLNSSFIGKSPFDIINSLNVGVTAGILLNHVKYLQKLGIADEKNELNNSI